MNVAPTSAPRAAAEGKSNDSDKEAGLYRNKQPVLLKIHATGLLQFQRVHSVYWENGGGNART